eukprot:1154452-Pelagomonas_calceolata.AAC.1
MQDLCLDLSERLCILSLCPGVCQGVGPETRQNTCGVKSGDSWKLSPGLPDQQRWLGTLSGAYSGGSRGLGRGSQELPKFGREKLKSVQDAQGAPFGEPTFATYSFYMN